MEKLVVTAGTGATSCLSVRLHDATRFRREHGVYPDEIDSSSQFLIYRDKPNQNVAEHIFGPYKVDNLLKFVDFDHGWQFGWYDQIMLDDLSRIAWMICPIGSSVGDQAYIYSQIIGGDRTAILYRGNDKVLEIPSTPYDAMIEMAKETGSQKFVVQTDEQEFLDRFKQSFPDTIHFDDIPRMSRNPHTYVMPPKGERVRQAVKFIAALLALSKCEKLVTGTGNTGLWTLLFRGRTQSVWQFHGQHQTYRKLG